MKILDDHILFRKINLILKVGQLNHNGKYSQFGIMCDLTFIKSSVSKCKQWFMSITRKNHPPCCKMLCFVFCPHYFEHKWMLVRFMGENWTNGFYFKFPFMVLTFLNTEGSLQPPLVYDCMHYCISLLRDFPFYTF